MNRFTLALSAVALTLSAVSSGPTLAAGGLDTQLRNLVQTKILPFVQKSIVVNSVKQQNRKNASLTEPQIIKLDKTWRAQVKGAGGALINEVLGNTLSTYLKQVKASNGDLFTEIFVMDNKGLNVGQSDVTSDYWQGDEAKWKKTFKVGPGTIHIGKVKMDESTQTLQAQVSVTIVDPETHQVIGAVTIGVNVEELG